MSHKKLTLQRVVLTASVVFAGTTAASAQQQIQPRMGAPLSGLTPAQLARFQAGKTVFTAPLSAAAGLGPIFNETSCSACHNVPAAGGGSTKFVTRFGKAASGPNPFDPLGALGGSLLQSLSINSPTCDEVVPSQADVTAKRLTPSAFGLGLVEAILDGDILVRETFPPPGISGEAHMVQPLEGGPQRVGRMGWKAQVATLMTFSADASGNEMGLTNPLLPTEQAPNGDLVLLAQCDQVPDPEDVPDAQGFLQIERQRDFQRFLAAPPQTPRSGMQGEVIFSQVKCADCHVATPYVADPTAEPGIAGKSFKPYSDFLLHDMGSLGDGIVQGAGGETELRTPSLWGLRVRAPAQLLHDGRVSGGTADQNLTQTILLHDGEALASRNLFAALPQADKDALLRFLDSLGRLEFDYEGNNNVDEVDWFFLQPLVNGPTPAYTPESPAAVADFDQDGDFDLVDFGWMQRAFTGQ